MTELSPLTATCFSYTDYCFGFQRLVMLKVLKLIANHDHPFLR